MAPGQPQPTRRSQTGASQTRSWPTAGSATVAPAGPVVAGRYRLRRLLGRGGMGAVWLAEDEKLHRRVAVKETILTGMETAEERGLAHARLLREARLAAQVDHPGTVRVYDLVEEAGRPWIVMELLPGRTLEAALREDGPLAVDQATGIALCLLDVLQATHRAGIVHRDVKPSNLQLCGGQRVVLTDFGIASATGDGPDGATCEIVGSPAYMSPERVRGADLEPASDYFSLGATLYAAVEGRSPFGKHCPAATLTAVVTDPPAPLLRAGALGPVIEGLLEKDPHRRLGPDQARRELRAIQVRGAAT